MEPGEIFGLKLTLDVSGSVIVHPGRCRNDANTHDLGIPLGETTAADPTVLGMGGLDKGVVQPRTSYAVYLVRTVSQTGALLSKSYDPAAVAFPTNSVHRRIGAVATNAASAIVNFEQAGTREVREYTYLADAATLAVLVDGQATVTTPFDLAPFFHVGASLATLFVTPGNGVPVTIAPLGPTGGPTLTVSAPATFGFQPSDLETSTMGSYRNQSGGGSSGVLVLGFSETV